MLRQALIRALNEIGGEVREEGLDVTFRKVLAERRAFLARKRLVYRAQLRVDDAARAVDLSESLTETSSGLAPDSGAGFKSETYRTRAGPREGSIAERAQLFGKTYAVTFDYSAIRNAIEAVARGHGHTVRYHVAGR